MENPDSRVGLSHPLGTVANMSSVPKSVVAVVGAGAGVRAVVAAIAELAGEDLEGRDGRVLGAETVALARAVESLRAQWLRRLGEFDASCAWEADGADSAAGWLAARSNLADEAALGRSVGMAGRLEALPATSKALAAGEIGVEHARQLVAASDTRGPDGQKGLTGQAEERLVAAAKGGTPGQLRPAVRAFQEAADAKAGVERARRQHSDRSLRMWTRAEDGMGCGFFQLPPDLHAVVAAALEAQRRRDRTAKDARTADQQRADALVALLQTGAGRIAGVPDETPLDTASTGVEGGYRAQVSVIIPLDTLRGGNGVGRLESGEAIGSETAKRWACDADVSRVLTGPGSAVVDFGRSRRTVSRSQRRLLEVRDGGCVYPGCGRPSLWCQSHHLRFWLEHEGPTDIDNLALLCWRHHHAIHEGGWILERTPGGWRVSHPDSRWPAREWEGPPGRDGGHHLPPPHSHARTDVGNPETARREPTADRNVDASGDPERLFATLSPD